MVDLVKDLSDGVSVDLHQMLGVINRRAGHSHTSPRVPLQRVPRSICGETEASSPAIRECELVARFH